MVLLWYYYGNIMVLSTEEKRRDSGLICKEKAIVLVLTYKLYTHLFGVLEPYYYH